MVAGEKLDEYGSLECSRFDSYRRTFLCRTGGNDRFKHCAISLPFHLFSLFFPPFFFYIYIPDHKIKGSLPSTMETGVISRLN